MNEKELVKNLKLYADFVLFKLQKWEEEGSIHRIATPVYPDRKHPEKDSPY